MGWYPMPAQKEVSNMEHNKGEVLWEYCDQGTCKHKDCARYWEDRERPCKFCGELIEIDTKRYRPPFYSPTAYPGLSSLGSGFAGYTSA